MQTRIKEIRQSQGVSLRMLAEESGIDKSTLCDVETGKTDSRVSTLLAIADALHVPLADLFDAPQPAQQPEPVQKQYDALAWAYVKIAERCIV